MTLYSTRFIPQLIIPPALLPLQHPSDACVAHVRHKAVSSEAALGRVDGSAVLTCEDEKLHVWQLLLTPSPLLSPPTSPPSVPLPLV